MMSATGIRKRRVRGPGNSGRRGRLIGMRAVSMRTVGMRALNMGVVGLMLLAGMGLCRCAAATSLWVEEAESFFANRKAMHIGDIVTVIIVEDASASNKSEMKLSKETSNQLDGKGAGKLDFIPLMSGGIDYQKEHQGKGETKLNGRMNARVTAEVIEVRPNGNLVVEGSRIVQINEDEDRILVRGVIRPDDIAADNTVLSTYLSEAQISYTGSGPNKNAARQGLVARLLDLLF